MQSQNRNSDNLFVFHLNSQFPLLLEYCLRENIDLEQLKILKTKNKHHFYNVCRMLNYGGAELALLKFYACTPGYSLELLFSYDEYHIRDMTSEDKALLLHKWLCKHQLTIRTKTLWGYARRIDCLYPVI